MLDELRQRNEALRADITAIVRMSADAKIVSDLEPYRSALLKSAGDLLLKIEKNLLDLRLGRDNLLPDILSETSTLIQWARVFKYRYLRPLHRASEWDRICLRTISWLHNQHADTKRFPPVFADDDISISPSIHLIPFYFFPCLEQRTLLFQPLFFHEFGHLLYRCHKRELDDLVGEFQQVVEAALLPASQRNDQYSQTQMRLRQSIVEAWYSWTQELFCDAIGLTIGGPCFLLSFSNYMAKYQTADFYRQPSNLHGSTHPVSWLRIQILVDRARQRGYEQTADLVIRQWQQTADLLRITEDYHGFYTDSLKPDLVKTLDDMLVEVSPRECSAEEANAVAGQERQGDLIDLLNRAWCEFGENPSQFSNWERQVFRDRYELEIT
jgi:hypothetical protein